MKKNKKTNYQIRTDIAFEELDFLELSKEANDEIVEEHSVDGLIIRKTYVNERISEEINKKSGLYYLIDSSNINDGVSLDKMEKALVDVLKDIFAFENIKPNDRGLVVGLGNINITPDSLGPLVCDNIFITRHLFDNKSSNDDSVDGLSNISSISPGVMGQTGLETSDIVKSIIQNCNIEYVIVIDSLASRSVKRVNKTIQITNAGISPGSGVGAMRKELSKHTLSIPVIAIGVPTVVDAVTIVSDTMEKVSKHYGCIKDKSLSFLDGLSKLNEREKRILFEDVLGENNFMVTPKSIDEEVEDLSRIISNALDKSLHSVLSK